MATGREFLQRAQAAVGDDGRLAPGGMASWDVFPFEADSLRVRRLDQHAVPEPDRRKSPAECKTCVTLQQEDLVLHTGSQLGVIRPGGCNLVFVANVVSRGHVMLDDLDDDGQVELGRLLTRTYGAMKGLDGVGNVHINKWENGSGHLSVTLLARPEGVLQLQGSNVTVWADMLPPTPADELDVRADEVRTALAGR